MMIEWLIVSGLTRLFHVTEIHISDMYQIKEAFKQITKRNYEFKTGKND